MLKELLDVFRKPIKVETKVVRCPPYPVMIPGITENDALDANDAMGTIVTLDVPKSGVIYSAMLYDVDDEGTQIDLEIFGELITQIANDAAWSPSDEDILKLITELAFVVGDDHDKSHTFQLTNIGVAYHVPEGKFYVQAVTRSTPTIVAVEDSPRFQLQILSDDPDWQER